MRSSNIAQPKTLPARTTDRDDRLRSCQTPSCCAILRHALVVRWTCEGSHGNNDRGWNESEEGGKKWERRSVFTAGPLYDDNSLSGKPNPGVPNLPVFSPACFFLTRWVPFVCFCGLVWMRNGTSDKDGKLQFSISATFREKL